MWDKPDGLKANPNYHREAENYPRTNPNYHGGKDFYHGDSKNE